MSELAFMRMMKNNENKHSSGADTRGALGGGGVKINLLFALTLGACTVDVQQPALEHPAAATQTVQTCPAQYLSTTPVAEQCCYSTELTNDNDGFMVFYVSATHQIVT